MSGPIPSRPRSKRPTVAADTPCRSCGKPIYYNYRGPVEGVCGKCTDRMRKGARGGNSRRILRMSFGRKGTVRDAGIALLVAIGIAASILAYLVFFS